MTDREPHIPTSVRSSLDTDKLRPALLLFGTQIVIALIGSVLLTNGVLA